MIRGLSLTLFLFIIDNSYGQESPKVNPFSSSIKPVIGGKTSFTCQSLLGSQPLSITWFKDEQELTNSPTARIRTNEDSSILTIDSIKSSHSGNYSCKISNRFGYDSYTSELLVQGSPSWIEKPKDLKIHARETAEIKCSIGGFPKPRVDWKKLQDSNWINLITSDTIELTRETLIIRNVSHQNKGRYGCSGSNGIEPDLWSEFELTIEGKLPKLFYLKIGAFISY